MLRFLLDIPQPALGLWCSVSTRSMLRSPMSGKAAIRRGDRTGRTHVWLVFYLQVVHVSKLGPEEFQNGPVRKSSHMISASEAWDQFCCIYSPREAHNGNLLKISFQLDNRLVNKRGSGGQRFHTLFRLYNVETWVISVSTPPCPPPPHHHHHHHQIKFSLHQRDNYSVAPDHFKAPLNEKTSCWIKLYYCFLFIWILIMFRRWWALSLANVCLFACLPVCLVHVVERAEKRPLRSWGAAVDVYPAAATRWSMITAERLSLWDASSSGGCC